MEVNCDIRSVRREWRRFDLLQASPLRQAPDVCDDVRPMRAAVARHLHDAVVCSDPDNFRINGRDSDGENRVESLCAAQV